MFTVIAVVTPFILMFILITYLNKRNKGKIPFETSDDDWSGLTNNAKPSSLTKNSMNTYSDF